MEKIPLTTAGEILNEEFLIPLNISAQELSFSTQIPYDLIIGIIQGIEKISEETALRLSEFFGNSASFWLGIELQHELDLQNEETLLN